MNSQRWRQVTDILDRAVDLDALAREALITRECAGDSALRADVERLIAADSRVHGFLEPVEVLQPHAPPVAAGARIGGYTLIRRIAAGGMGVVFEAQQERPNRRVALKLVQSALADASTLRRFQYEAEALGRLRHPGIAQVYEAGVDIDASGEERPYLAMEFVEGARSLTTYVREQALADAQRLRLFVDVCAAVQHGHERGVLHRDLKASNVLVDSSDAVKLIDFGIAKVLGDEHTRATLAGELVGTLSSMSPEQLDGDLDALDVRSDVYALGALFYETLCEVPPIDLRGLSLSEALSKARTAVPRAPTAIRADLPIELEWIVLRAIEPERERRYPSVADFAADIDRFLNDQPLHASPPSTVYRMRKFVRRNRLGVIAGVAILTAILGGSVLALVERDRAVAARDRAKDAEALATTRLERLEAEANTNRELAEFQSSILSSADPDRGGRDKRVVDALRSASLDLDARKGLEPKLWLALRHSIVDAYVSLGLIREASQELERMRPVWEAACAPDDKERLALERTQFETDSNLESLGARLPEVLDGLARAQSAPEPAVGEIARWQLLAGHALVDLGRFDEAESLVTSAHGALAAKFGPASGVAIETQLSVAEILAQMRLIEQSDALRRRALEIATAGYGPDHRLTLLCLESVAFSDGVLGRSAEATAKLREIVDAHTRRTGATSTQALSARSKLAEFLYRSRRPTEALVEIDRALADGMEVLGERSKFVQRARVRRAAILIVLDRIDEGIASFEEALRGVTAQSGPDDSDAVEIRSQLAFALFRMGRFEQALPHCREAWLASCRTLGEESPITLTRGNGYAVVLAQSGHEADAVPVLEWLLEIQERKLGPMHEDSILTLKNMAMIQLDAGDLEAATCSGELLVARAEATEPRNLVATAGAHWALAHALQKRHEFETAWEQFAIASRQWSQSEYADTEIAIFGLIDEAGVLETLGRAAEELAILESAAAIALRTGLAPSIRSRAITEYAEALHRSGDEAQARGLAEMVLSGWTEIEPKIRARAERILQRG